MKSLIFIISLAFITCTDEASHGQNESIYGTWNLIKVTAGFSPIEEFTEGQIIWEFNSQKLLLVTINTELSESSNITLRENGEYDFVIIDENIIRINDDEYNYFLLEKEKLIISFEEASDGPRMEFIKAN